MTRARTDLRNAALCGLVTAVALLAVWPTSPLSFDDDWSFAWTVKRLAETGRVTYNGWSSPSVLTQSYWGLAFVRLFGGFSFDALRASTYPPAVASVVLTYALARRAGLAAGAAVFAAMTLCGSPLFLPLATSFMTDVPGLFCLLAAGYATVRAIETPRRPRTLAWLAAAVAIAAVGGSSRQIVWVVPLATLPYVAWRRRSDRTVVIAAAVAWVAAFATAALIQRWFNAQPYTRPEPSIVSELALAIRRPLPVAGRFLAVLLTVLLVTLPPGLTVLGRIVHDRRLARATAATGLLIAMAFVLEGRNALAFWMGNLITPAGLFTVGQICGDPPTVLGRPVRLGLTLAVFAVAAVLVGRLIVAISHPRPTWAAIRRSVLDAGADRATVPVLLLIGFGYLGLLLTRCVLDVSYDRHLLSLVPCFTIPLLTWSLRRRRTGGADPVPVLAWVALVAFGTFAVAATQEELARGRAIVAAVDRVRAAGVPRTAVNGGFEYDSWTELQNAGYINLPQVVNPPGAYRPGLGQRPSLHYRYRIEYQPLPDARMSRFGTVGYFSLLPPFHRQLSVDEIVTAAGTAAPETTPGPPLPPAER